MRLPGNVYTQGAAKTRVIGHQWSERCAIFHAVVWQVDVGGVIGCVVRSSMEDLFF